MKPNWGIAVIIAIVVGAVAFYGGMQYEKTKVAPNSTGGQYAQNGQGGQNGQGQARQGGGQFGMRRGNGGATTGEVISQDATSITVKLQDGSSKIINISGSTTFSKTDTATAGDIKTGTRVAAFGTTNSDGSITAQNVQLNPSINRFGGNGQGTSPGMMQRQNPGQ